MGRTRATRFTGLSSGPREYSGVVQGHRVWEAPVFELHFKDLSKGTIQVLLDVERRHDVRVGLAAQKVVDVEHLTQATHGEVLLQ